MSSVQSALQTAPLTPSQLHLWKSQALAPDAPLYNQIITIDFTLNGPASDAIAAFQKAWRVLQTRHPVLTSTVCHDVQTGVFQQFGHPARTLDVVDSTAYEPCDEPFASVIKERGQRSFDLSQSLCDAALFVHAQYRYTLFINAHHLILDAVSARLVADQISRLVHAQLDTASVDPGPLPDSAEQNSFLNYARSLDQAVATTPAPSTPVPSTGDFSLPEFYGKAQADLATRSVRHPVCLSADELNAIQTLSTRSELKQFNLNLFHLCFYTTALVLFLHKSTEENTIVIEAPVAGRVSPQWRTAIGNFIEMVKIRVDVVPGDSLLRLYQSIRDHWFDAIAQVKSGCTAKLQPSRVHGVINLITALPDAADGPCETMHWYHSGHHDAHHPIRLHVTDWNRTGRLSLELDAIEACFRHIPAGSVPSHIRQACRCLLGDWQLHVSDVSLLDPKEQWQLHGYPQAGEWQPEALISRLDRICAQHEQATAIITASGSLNFAQMYRQSHSVAAFCTTQQLNRGDRLVLWMEPCIELPIIMQGLLRCGIAFIPVDHAQPAQRVKQILADSQARQIIVSDRAQIEQLGDLSALNALVKPPVCAAQVFRQTDIANNVRQLEVTEPDENTLAYIIYTSGSTGVPKGVKITHAALTAYLCWAAGFYRLNEPLVMPLLTSISFDMTITALFLPLLTGGQLIIPEHTENEQTDTILKRVLTDGRINTVKLTPSHLQILNALDLRNDSIRQLIVGGEDFKSATAAETLKTLGSSIRIINEYGPTEATVGCVVHDYLAKSATGVLPGPVPDADTDSGLGAGAGASAAASDESVPIGQPISGMTAYVLNRQGMPQFEGAIGELYLAGQSLSTGYWNNDQQTQAVFLSAGWAPDIRLYKTGDLVRIRDSRLHYLGRTDSQIKRNGFRIELAEIESCLLKHPAIETCAVVATGSAQGRSDKKQQAGTETHCRRCGLSSWFPDADIDSDQVCSLCRDYDRNQSRIAAYFRESNELKPLIKRIRQQRTGDYDALVLLSGGKDSTYALCQLVDLGLKVYAFSLDNGYLSDQAKSNIDFVCKALKIDHHYASTESMDAIFKDSLTRYSNVCHGCFKTIYNLSMQFAEQHAIKTIFTGLSRGQLFETRLDNQLFSDPRLSAGDIDSMVQAARVQYHAVADAPNRLLNIRSVNDGTLPTQIEILDFYRYWHVELRDMLRYLEERIGWRRPPDTGRSTNCLINDVGIHVHKAEKGYHNYSLPYSWDVRLGHKRRQEALEELDDDIDLERTMGILRKIGYQIKTPASTDQAQWIVAYVTGSKADNAGANDDQAVLDWLRQQLPDYLLPNAVRYLDRLPLNDNGKVDRKALASQDINSRLQPGLSTDNWTASEIEIADIWQQFLPCRPAHQNDHFFRLGGDSLSAIRCVMALRNRGYRLDPIELFRNPVLAQFSKTLEQCKAADTESAEKHRKSRKKFSALSAEQQKKLKQILNR